MLNPFHICLKNCLKLCDVLNIAQSHVLYNFPWNLKHFESNVQIIYYS